MVNLLALIPVALVFAIFNVTAIREWHVFSLLPYGSFGFFALFILIALVIYGLRKPLERVVSYPNLIFALNLGFFIFLFPQPVHVLFFAAYFYSIYYLVQWNRVRIWPSVALLFTLLPMLVARSTREIQFVGLSYVTFRAFHLIMDAPYIERIDPKRYFSFLMFFPSVLAGPIDRWQKFAPQLQKGFSNLSAERFALGYRLMLFGACLKFVFADWVNIYLLSGGLGKWGEHLGEFYGYPLYLYFDFAGYSAMAIGCALMIGLVLPENFNKPYLSHNPQDFWRRFHITLGDWLRDYFFKPIYKMLSASPLLPGRPLLKQNVAIFMTFFLMGCWNGLKAHYLISGSLFGFYSVIYNSYIYWGKRRGGAPVLFGSPRFTRCAAIFLTVNACCFALYIFGGRTELFK